MSATNSPSTFNPSLGVLGRLPGELRNVIYDLAINTEHELEVDYHKPCRQRQSLHLVSRQVHAETKSLMAAFQARSSPCEHVNFSVRVPKYQDLLSFFWSHQLGQRISTRDVRQQSKPHNIANAKSIRFVTGHLGGQAPTAVTCYLRFPLPSTCQVFGAPARKDLVIQRAVNFLLGILQKEIKESGESTFSLPSLSRLAERIRTVCGAKPGKSLSMANEGKRQLPEQGGRAGLKRGK